MGKIEWSAKCSFGKNLKGHKNEKTLKDDTYEGLMKRLRKVREYAKGRGYCFKHDAKAVCTNGEKRDVKL